MDQVVEISYRRHRLGLVEVENGGRGVVLDVFVDGRYRSRVHGVVTQTDLLRWTNSDEPRFVALVARCAAERLRTQVGTDRAVISAGASPTFACSRDLFQVFPSLVMPNAGSVVLSFATTNRTASQGTGTPK